MNKQELMIGDWVWNSHNQKAEQVIEIRETGVMLDYNDIYDYDEIEAIPLTAEILKKNGFESDCDKKIYKNKSYSNIRIRHFFEYSECDFFSFGEMVDCYDTPQFNIWFSVSYVHEL